MNDKNGFSMDQNSMVKFLVTTIDNFIRDRLINKELRAQHKEQCAERLAAEEEGYDKEIEVRYADQAVLANLDWGMEALEEAVNTSNMETKLARLDYAEKMLQVCALLNANQKTAGVPNFYLSAWAHLNLSYLWKLRNDIHNSVLHVLEMFIVDPFFSRIDFAPELWKDLFLPHMSSIVGWYSQERHRLVMQTIPDSSDLSFTADLDQFFNESVILSMRPDQLEKMQKLENLYGESLDENTRLFAKYYKDYMSFDSTSSKKVIPMFPIAEPPMTPLHEVSKSIPDYVKFGPILPTSAGFSSIIQSKHDAREPSRATATSTTSQTLEESTRFDSQEGLLDENEDDYEYQANDVIVDSDDMSSKSISIDTKMKGEDNETGPEALPYEIKNQTLPYIFSPLDSPRTPSPKIPSPEPDKQHKQEPLLRLLSSRITDSIVVNSLPTSPHIQNDCNTSSTESDNEATETQKNCRKISRRKRGVSFDNENNKVVENSNSSIHEGNEGSQSFTSLPMSEKPASRTRPPKDFVCPITSHIFCDPVTLETGQTYERRAIQEWLERGNITCPITRQSLSATSLPKTNYVLKRLITSWKEQYPDLAQEFSYSETPKKSFSSHSTNEIPLASTPSRTSDFSSHLSVSEHTNNRNKRFVQVTLTSSPTSVISQAEVETIIGGLKPHVSCLCNSDNLQECEAAVLAIIGLWKDSKADLGVQSYLSNPTIVNGFVEILSASMNREVLVISIYLLSELIVVDERVREALTSVDCDFDCLATLLKNGLAEAAVLIYQLKPSFSQLALHDLIPSLIQIILHNTRELHDLQLVMEPVDAAIALLEQVLMGGDKGDRSLNALNVISANGIPALLKCLARLESRKSIVFIILCCMQAEKSCRSLIANRIDLSPILELFHAENDNGKSICIEFLSELVRLNRRTFRNQILQIIKDEGAFSTMHTFLVYLQMAPVKQQPAIAALLLQLDLLVEPRKMSMYREEAIDALIEAVRRKDYSNSQMAALDALLSLSGRLTSTGEHYTEAWLLKIAGFDQPYNALMKTDELRKQDNDLIGTMEEEEKAASSWEKRVAFELCNHEKGSIFKALEECFKSDSLEVAKSCLVLATWLTYMLSTLPQTSIRSVALNSLLNEFVNVLKSSKNLEEKILATLAVKTFISDPAAHEALGAHAKYIYRTLRELKRNSVVVTDIMKALVNLSSADATELWGCTELVELDGAANGEVMSLLHLNGWLLSSHSDGTIKVWNTGRRAIRLIQEVRKHTKAVTCLYASPAGNKLYSGSSDKTIRVWAVKPEEIHCLEVHDVKEAVYELTANNEVACYVSSGTGVKVYKWSGASKHINFNKYVKCLTMSGDKLYCGCSVYSIQEVDLRNYTSTTFYAGTRKLLGKQVIHSLQIRDDLLFAGGSSVDATAGKVFSLPTKAVRGSFSTGYDVYRISVNNDFIYTATRCGIIEVWLKQRVRKVASIKMAQAKITSLTSNEDETMLFGGSSDGKIQVWGLD